MMDAIKGFVQLALVIVFIIGSLVASRMLQSEKSVINGNGNGERELFVEVREVSPGPYRISFTTTGSIETRADVEIVPQVSGRVISVDDQFFAGGDFEADKPLFQIEKRDFELEVDRLKAQVAQASTGFSLENAESEVALEEWRFLNGDAKAPALVARKPQKAEAWANLKAARAQLDTAKLNLERTTYSLPFEGRVLASSLAEGQFVTAGQSYGQVFDFKAIEVRASLEDRQLDWLLNATEPSIAITATYLGETKTYKGHLKRGASALDPQTRFAGVSFGFDEDGVRNLLPGVFVDVQIEGETLQGVSVLPASALQKDGSIWAVNDEQKLVRLLPFIVYGDGDTIALKNLNGSSRIVVSKIPGAVEGATVVVSKKADP